MWNALLRQFKELIGCKHPSNAGGRALANKTDAAHVDCGKAIHAKGWEQGSLLPADANILLPEKLYSTEQTIKYFIVCSQSCTVVSNSLARDPYVELIAITKTLTKYGPKTQEAIGKDQRKLHLSIQNSEEEAGVEISINNRFEIDRACLLGIEPHNTVLNTGEAKKLAQWLARNYTRVALPNALVAELKEHFLPKLKSWLDEKLPRLEGKIGADVFAIYIDWNPRDESDLYNVRFHFVCESDDIVESFETSFTDTVSSLRVENNSKLVINTLICTKKEETYLSDLDGYERFSEYDYLTNMGDWCALTNTQ